jgi:hypothetical protein
MNLSSIKNTRKKLPIRMVLYGEGKIGKTTFASKFPNAVGILAEEGADFMDVNAFPVITDYEQVFDALEVLTKEKHNYQNLFIDSMDWMEPMLWAHVCNKNKWKDIESPGWGKGYAAALEEWNTFLDSLDYLRKKKSMGIILIAHNKVKPVNDPLMDNYDSHLLKLHDKAAGLLLEWADIIGYAGYKIFVDVEKNGSKKEVKATGTGVRTLYLQPGPCHCAGNRMDLKDMNFDYKTFSAALEKYYGGV